MISRQKSISGRGWHAFFNLMGKPLIMKKVYFSLVAAFLSVLSFAQDTKKVDVDINTKGDGGNWYASPWVWVVGAAVFILLLVALTRGSGRRAD
jgi:hypothetical protein